MIKSKWHGWQPSTVVLYCGQHIVLIVRYRHNLHRTSHALHHTMKCTTSMNTSVRAHSCLQTALCFALNTECAAGLQTITACDT